MSNKSRFWLNLSIKYIGVVLFVVLLMIISARAGQHKAEQIYNIQLQQYIEQAEAEKLALSMQPAIVEDERKAEAEKLAKLLYGVKDNNTDDLKTLCWCVINRVDNPLYPNSIADVIEQPDQWVRYDSENPVLQDLYNIARAELDTWHGGGYRPCDMSYVFMSWTANEISLRNEFITTPSTRYWRIK